MEEREKIFRKTKVIKKSKSDQSQGFTTAEVKTPVVNVVTDCLSSLAGRHVPPAGGTI